MLARTLELESPDFGSRIPEFDGKGIVLLLELNLR